MPGIFLDQDDVCIYVTEACNSNCIMCPMSLDSRKRGKKLEKEEWSTLTRVIPREAKHITITGGEPFLEYEKLIPAMEMIAAEYANTEVLILTNGRALSIPDIFEKVSPILTERFCLAIPVHGPDAKLHDAITQSVGSFQQTMKALHYLKKTNSKIEIRIVGHRLNIDQINNTLLFLADSDLRITTINIIAMEMTGCAAANRKELWVDYNKLSRRVEDGIRYVLKRGINIGLYNFPLCAVPHELWAIAKNSISPGKVRYAEECKLCREYSACGGQFYSTYELGLFPVIPMRG